MPYVWHDRLGWLTQCPSNLGTCCEGTITIKLPKLANEEEKLTEILTKYNIQVKSVQEDGITYILRTTQKLAIAEIDIAKGFHDCVMEIINYEKMEITTE